MLNPPTDTARFAVKDHPDYLAVGYPLGSFLPPDEIATQEDFNTRKGVERVIRYAFELAKKLLLETPAQACLTLFSETAMLASNAGASRRTT